MAVQGRAWYGGSTLTATGYHYWQSQLGRNDFTYGQFGENFTVDGLSDQEACIGDRYRVGGALFGSDAAARYLLPGGHPHGGAADCRDRKRWAHSGVRPAPSVAGVPPAKGIAQVRESSSVISLMLEPADGAPLTAALPGQFVAVRLPPMHPR
jgi:hypothetical protein